ncbi:MAG: hypothetical protein BWY28_01132 [bacterium ADurb.Bin236]|nr:MAG: hypothetical protein BWY28_01132 [bacterium ADurb.Bin236]HOY62086.1 hypothetical protein [bacterium]HPN95087.1 hypothetical protein [bacterium]
MKRIVVAVVFALACAALAGAPAKAAGTVNLNYWINDLSTDGEKLDQNAFVINGVIGIPETKWSAIFEYLNSGSDSDSANTFDAESNRYLVGARYDFEGGLYATLAYQNNEIDISSAAGSGSVDSNGIRIGGGYAFAFEGTPWTGNIDLGLGIANDASESGIVGSESADSSEFDLDLKFSYKLPYEGLKANIGYRYQKINLKWDGGSDNNKYDGFYLGVGYDYK